MANKSVWATSAGSGIFTSEITPDLFLILDSLPDGIYGVDATGRTVLVNKAAADMLGYLPGELIGTVPHEVMHHTRPDGTPYPHEECPLAIASRDGREVTVEEDVFWRRDGTSFPVSYESHCLRREGAVVGSVLTFRDITKQKKHDERMRELLRDQFALAKAEFQRAQLRDVLAQMPAVICVTRGPRHVIEVVNDQYREIVGETEVVGHTVRETFPAATPEMLAMMDIAYESGVPQRAQEVPVAVQRKDSTRTNFYDYVYQPLRDESGFVYGLMTHAVDVTERKHVETTLLDQSRLTALTADIGLALTTTASLREMLQRCAEVVVRHLDAAFARVWTLNEAEQVLELQASAGLYTHLDGPHARVPVGKFKIGRIAEERTPHLTNDVLNDERVGDREWARREGMQAFAGYPLMIGDRLVGVLAMFARRELSDATLRALGTVANGLALGVQRKDAENALRQRAEEMTRLAGQLERTNHELDAFAYAASHDLRAPLRGIANLAQWIEEDLTASGELRSDTGEMLALMRSRMHRMEALIEGILQYSRAGKVAQELEWVSTKRIVQDVLDLANLPPGALLNVGELPEFRTAPLPLQQIFLNLIGNAFKYANRPDPVVTIAARDADRFYEFSVTDNGPGIPPEFHDRIWGIFQTLEARDKVEGTGIGLSLVKKLVEGQGGRAWVESQPGAGATFKFLWPKIMPSGR